MRVNTMKRGQTNQDGIVMVEFALSILLVLFILSAVVYIGSIFRESNSIVEASRHGARTAGGFLGLNPAPSKYNDAKQLAINATNEYLRGEGMSYETGTWSNSSGTWVFQAQSYSIESDIVFISEGLRQFPAIVVRIFAHQHRGLPFGKAVLGGLYDSFSTTSAVSYFPVEAST